MNILNQTPNVEENVIKFASTNPPRNTHATRRRFALNAIYKVGKQLQAESLEIWNMQSAKTDNCWSTLVKQFLDFNQISQFLSSSLIWYAKCNSPNFGSYYLSTFLAMNMHFGGKYWSRARPSLKFRGMLTFYKSASFNKWFQMAVSAISVSLCWRVAFWFGCQFSVIFNQLERIPQPWVSQYKMMVEWRKSSKYRLETRFRLSRT